MFSIDFVFGQKALKEIFPELRFYISMTYLRLHCVFVKRLTFIITRVSLHCRINFNFRLNRNLKYMIEWLLSFHEVVEVSREFRELMNEKTMMHSEFNANAIHHELIGSKALSYHKNVVKLFNFLFNKGNPSDVWAQNNPSGSVRMQNLLTRQLIDSEIAKRYLKLLEKAAC